MKKALSFYLVVTAILISIFSIAACAESPKIDTGEIPFASGPITKTHEIVPTIELNNPGLLKVTISWTTPNLTFVKKVLTYNSTRFSCYGLSSNVGVVFHIVNESSVGTEAAFKGDVVVTPSYTWPGEYDAYNITIRPEILDQVIELPLNGTNDTFKMLYSNNGALIGEPLSLNLTADQIKEIMKATVSFEIKMKP